MTFNDLSRPQMTSDRKNFDRGRKRSISGFRKYIPCKKSKFSIFKSIFENTREMYENDPNPAKSSKTYIMDLNAPFGLDRKSNKNKYILSSFQDPRIPLWQNLQFHTTHIYKDDQHQTQSLHSNPIIQHRILNIKIAYNPQKTVTILS